MSTLASNFGIVMWAHLCFGRGFFPLLSPGSIRLSQVSSVLLYHCAQHRHWDSRNRSKAGGDLYLACVHVNSCFFSEKGDWNLFKQLLFSLSFECQLVLAFESNVKNEWVKSLPIVPACCKSFVCVCWFVFRKLEIISHSPSLTAVHQSLYPLLNFTFYLGGFGWQILCVLFGLLFFIVCFPINVSYDVSWGSLPVLLGLPICRASDCCTVCLPSSVWLFVLIIWRC